VVDAAKRFYEENAGRRACLVTDEWMYKPDMERLRVEDLPLDVMQRVLHADP
jgi:hypothetical protein